MTAGVDLRAGSRAVTGGPRPPLAGAGISIRDVFRIYREADIETVALRGVDLEVEDGEYVAIMGRSGSGKSTLLQLIAGADRPTAGQVIVAGVDLAQIDEAHRSSLRGSTIGLVFQSGNLVDFLDLIENVQLACQLAGRPLAVPAVLEILDLVGLADAATRRAVQLSGGEQQRAALAVILASRPRVLLADELTGELDRATAAMVLDLIDLVHATDRPTIVLATHDPALAARADRVVELRDGRVVDGQLAAGPPAAGTPDEAAR